MNYKEAKSKLEAALKLLDAQSTSKERFDSLVSLIKGINPNIDKKLELVAKELEMAEKIHKSKVIELAAEHLPENTQEQKKRKKYLLLFIKYWNELKNEVIRVKKELNSSEEKSNKHQQASALGKIFTFAKGPVGIITIAAVGIVVLMKAVSVEVVIKNEGCEYIDVGTSFPVRIPGLSLPKNSIANGASETATIPAVPVSVDFTDGDSVNLKIAGLRVPVEISTGKVDFIFNGSTLLYKETDLNLGASKRHELIVRCENL